MPGASGTIFVQDGSWRVHAFGLRNHAERWRWDAPKSAQHTACRLGPDGTLVVASTRGQLRGSTRTQVLRLSPKNGAARVIAEVDGDVLPSGASLTVSRETAYLVCDDRVVVLATHR